MSEKSKKPTTIDEFIADFPKDIQLILEKIRKLIQELVPDAEEAIAYGIPTFRLKKKNLVHFSAFKTHIGFYPTPTGMEKFNAQLSKYKSGKGSAQFPLNQPIPYDLIKEITQFRINEILTKEKQKK